MTFAIFVAPMLSPSASRMVEATASLRGVRLAVISQDPAEGAPESVRASMAAHWRIDDVTDPSLLHAAVRTLATVLGKPDRLFGAYEQLQVPLAQVREAMGIEGMGVETALNFRDKARMKDALRAAGLPVARHALVEHAADAWLFAREAGLPLVLKPPAGAGSLSTYRANTVDELRRALEELSPSPARPVLVEEFLTGTEHSLETVSVGGQAVWHSLTRYYPAPLEVVEHSWIQWAVVLPRESLGPEFADMRETGARALQALGLDTGLTHMEWFRRPDGSVAISEVAARPPGAQITTMISRANDVDFVQAWARLMIAGTFDPPVQKYAVGAAFLRGQGRGAVRAVQGLREMQAEVGHLIVDARLPHVGQVPTGSYEGEGFVIVRHPETAVVEQAVQRIVSLVRVELA